MKRGSARTLARARGAGPLGREKEGRFARAQPQGRAHFVLALSPFRRPSPACAPLAHAPAHPSHAPVARPHTPSPRVCVCADHSALPLPAAKQHQKNGRRASVGEASWTSASSPLTPPPCPSANRPPWTSPMTSLRWCVLCGHAGGLECVGAWECRGGRRAEKSANGEGRPATGGGRGGRARGLPPLVSCSHRPLSLSPPT